MKSIDQFNFNGQKVLIRVDYNVPLDDNFNVTDSSGIITISAIKEIGITKIEANDNANIPIAILFISRPP